MIKIEDRVPCHFFHYAVVFSQVPDIAYSVRKVSASVAFSVYYLS